MLRAIPALLCAVLAPVPAARAQVPPQPKTEAELAQQVVQTLVGFARSAETWKAWARARVAYKTILDHYDAENANARTALGWKKVKGEWQRATPPDKLPADAATPAQRKLVDDAWRTASKRAGGLHRTFGLALDGAGNRERAIHHLERALAFLPDDVECHRALGHGELDGFYGTAEQIAFVQRMRAIFAKAREIAATPVTVESVPADQMPAELKKLGITFAGARSKYITCWVAGTDDEAKRSAIANERTVLLLRFLFGDDPERNRFLQQSPMRWACVLRSDDQRDVLLESCVAARGGEPLERARLYGGARFQSATGEAVWMQHPANVDEDRAAGNATKHGTPWFTPGFSEGLVHTMTWLLCGTMDAFYMKVPATEASKKERPVTAAEWLASLRADIDRGEDWPLVHVPRERIDNFRDVVRFKSWSFVTWLMARHPDAWVELLVEIGHDEQMPEDVAAIFTKTLGRGIEEVEAEWREWARAGSRIGKASGLPQ